MNLKTKLRMISTSGTLKIYQLNRRNMFISKDPQKLIMLISILHNINYRVFVI
jgi:hypothetical protein